MTRRLAVVGAIAALAVALSAAQVPGATLLLISLDGWRWDYHTLSPVTHLRSLMARGVRAEALIPSFPTKTFPNHYTLVTGLYPGHHGVVGNTMRDPRTGRLFSMQARDEIGDARWWGGDPIWNAVERAGRPSAPLFWPGSEAAIGGVRPAHWQAYAQSRPNSERVDQVLAWLDLPPARRPAFITLYVSDVDAAGHTFGPGAPELVRTLVRVDDVLGRLLNGLDRRGLIHAINIVVTSDHGMAETSLRRVVFLEDVITPGDAEIVGMNPTLGVWPRPGRGDAIYRRLATAHPRLAVYRRHETPAHWVHRDHERIPPILGVMEEGWSILPRARAVESFARNPRRTGGNHGYDPRLPSMHALFVAAGPAFKQAAVVPPFENVDVYNILCAVLGLTPAENDGDPSTARAVLKAVPAGAGAAMH